MEKAVKHAIKKDLKVKEKVNIEIRDSLAIERTKLANERTFLAYVRTAMALVIAGFSLMKFFEEDIYKLVGIAFIPLGIASGTYGMRRFIRKKKEIDAHKEAYTPTSHTHAAVAHVEEPPGAPA